MSEEKDFDAAFEERLKAAVASLAAAENSSSGRTPSRPRRCGSSPSSTKCRTDGRRPRSLGDAARLYAQLYNYHPTLLSVAMTEQAQVPVPRRPRPPRGRATAIIEAIAAVPPIGARERLIAPIRENLCAYYLAEGRESDAAAILADLMDARDPNTVTRRMGEDYAQLAFSYLGRARRAAGSIRPVGDAGARPGAGVGATQIIRAQTAFEAGRTRTSRMPCCAEAAGVATEQINAILARALAARPGSVPLRELADRRGVRPASTMPATQESAETQPETPSTRPG